MRSPRHLSMIAGAVATSVALLCSLLAALASPAAAQVTTVPACFATATTYSPEFSDIYFELPKVVDGSLAVRHNDGREVNPHDYSAMQRVFRSGIANRPADWRVVTRNGSTEVVGPRCQEATRINPTAPQATLEWLPGATMEGEGARGAARISWQPVTHNGVAPSHYEVHKYAIRDNDLKPSSDRLRQAIDAVVVPGSATSVDIDLGMNGPYGNGFGTADIARIRAWWPDGVSEAVEIAAPQQVSFDGDDSLAPNVTDLFRVSGDPQLGTGRVELAWTMYRQRTAPDRFQIISVNNGDGAFPTSWAVTHEFSGDTQRALVDWSDSFLGGTRFLRAVWDNAGPLGGPVKADASIGGLIQRSSDLRISRVLPTSARVTTTTQACSYGDYRVVELGTGELVGSFDAPHPDQCYYEHGITLGVDTAPLEPNRYYAVTFVEVGIAQTRPWVLNTQMVAFSTAQANTPLNVGVSYTAEEAALVDQAAAKYGVTFNELQEVSTLLFAYLAAVEDKPAVRLEAPLVRGPRYANTRFEPAQITQLDNLADHFGGLTRPETAKTSTLVLAYVILTS